MNVKSEGKDYFLPDDKTIFFWFEYSQVLSLSDMANVRLHHYRVTHSSHMNDFSQSFLHFIYKSKVK